MAATGHFVNYKCSSHRLHKLILFSKCWRKIDQIPMVHNIPTKQYKDRYNLANGRKQIPQSLSSKATTSSNSHGCYRMSAAFLCLQYLRFKGNVSFQLHKSLIALLLYDNSYS